MATATIETTALPLDALKNLSPAQRIQVLRELVKLCFLDGSLDKPLKVTGKHDPFSGYVAAIFPRTKTPLPDLTDEERAELQRRIDNRQDIMSEKEFIAEIRRRIKERAEEAETQRRIENRHNAISHEEFVARVCRIIRERPESE